jgi:phosphatidylserine/phosphatidylglycerophosphate/cardiolipin synthase-like enzyme
MSQTPSLEDMLRATLDDRRLSRAERRALAAVLDELEPDGDRVAALRSRAFALVRQTIDATSAKDLVDWLEDVMAMLASARPSAAGGMAEARFGPGDACLRLLVGEIDAAQRTIDACVFTVTDDRIAAAMLGAHRRGVALRLITDAEKSDDEGSDVERLARAGVSVRMDRTPFHMHHKFAIFDGARLVNGSYNWTRQASTSNHENVILVDDTRLVAAFARAFEELWASFGEAP